MNVCVGGGQKHSVHTTVLFQESLESCFPGAIYKFLSGHQVTLGRSSQLYSHAPHKFEM